jgi:superfamily I DNA/RNA helicase
VPLVVLGGSSVFRSREAEAVMAYSVLSEYDAIASLDQILNRPKRFLPHSFVGAVHKVMEKESDLVKAIRTASITAGLKPGPRRGASQLADDIEHLRALEWDEVPSAIEELLSRAPEREVEGIDEDRMGLVRSVCTIARKFPTVLEFVTFAQKCFDGTSSLDEGTKANACVTISTCHKVKGLSWRHVYLSAPRAMFPHTKASNLSEEERLFYVAITRAEDRLTITSNRESGGPTHFLPPPSTASNPVVSADESEMELL